MGCVSSKNLNQKPHVDSDIKSFPRRGIIHPSDLIQDGYRQSIMDISDSYTLLKALDSAKSEELKLKQKGHAYVLSMEEVLFETFNTLESKDSILKLQPQKENASNPSFQMHRSSSVTERSQSKTAALETIDVADIMEGLDEDTSGLSSPSQDVKLLSALRSPSLSSVSTSLLNKFNHGSYIDTVQNVNETKHNENAPVILSLTAQPDEDLNKAIPTHNFDNAKILKPDSQSDVAISITPQLHLVPPVKSLSRDGLNAIDIVAPPKLTYSASSGKLTLTFSMEYENKLFTSSPVGQEWPITVNSSENRSLVNPSDVKSESHSPVFDPVLVDSYEKFLKDLRKEEWDSLRSKDEIFDHNIVDQDFNASELVKAEAMLDLQLYDPLDAFEKKCPPGGDESIVLYTTTLRGIRKTFEDCNTLREILRSLNLSIDERDVSMQFSFRNELTELMGEVVSVPRLFIKGRYIGGGDDVSKLHEIGKLHELVERIPRSPNIGTCDGCGGIRFIPCLECSGSHKIVNEYKKVLPCPDCNENGLIQCPICS